MNIRALNGIRNRETNNRAPQKTPLERATNGIGKKKGSTCSYHVTFCYRK
jgi:hypothetical protein